MKLNLPKRSEIKKLIQKITITLPRIEKPSQFAVELEKKMPLMSQVSMASDPNLYICECGTEVNKKEIDCYNCLRPNLKDE